MTGFSRSSMPARPTSPKNPPLHRYPSNILFQGLWRPTLHASSRWYPLELSAFGHRRPQVQRDCLQFPLAMISLPTDRIILQKHGRRIKTRPRVLFDPPADCKRRASDGFEMIVRSQESAPGTQAAPGGPVPCPASIRPPLKSTCAHHGPWIAAPGSSWCREPAGEISPVSRGSL